MLTCKLRPQNPNRKIFNPAVMAWGTACVSGLTRVYKWKCEIWVWPWSVISQHEGISLNLQLKKKICKKTVSAAVPAIQSTSSDQSGIQQCCSYGIKKRLPFLRCDSRACVSPSLLKAQQNTPENFLIMCFLHISLLTTMRLKLLYE